MEQEKKKWIETDKERIILIILMVASFLLIGFIIGNWVYEDINPPEPQIKVIGIITDILDVRETQYYYEVGVTFEINGNLTKYAVIPERYNQLIEEGNTLAHQILDPSKGGRGGYFIIEN